MSKRRWTRACFGLLPLVLALVALGISVPAEEVAEPSEPADPWGPLKLLVGTWQGEIEGKLGAGTGVRRYELIMSDRYLLSRHLSIRLPQEKSPEGDQHEELGVFSFDRERKTLVYREFMQEGVVVRSPCKVEGTKVVCVSEAVAPGCGCSGISQLRMPMPAKNSCIARSSKSSVEAAQ